MQSHEKDTPVSAGIYIPVKGSIIGRAVIAGSGIVGSPSPEDGLLLHYEGNAYNALNLIRWKDRVRCAAGRHFTRYPTCATMHLARNELSVIRVGEVSGRDARDHYSLRIEPAMFADVERYAGEAIEYIVDYAIEIDGVADPVYADAETIGVVFNNLTGINFGSHAEWYAWLAQAEHYLRQRCQVAAVPHGTRVRMRINGDVVAESHAGSFDKDSRVTEALRRQALRPVPA